MPMREMVAGEAQLRSCDSNRKLTFGPNWILSPEGMVNNLLSSSTELRDSIHSGSISPSQTIHDWILIGSRTTWRAAFVRTPSDHSRVSMSICPRSCWGKQWISQCKWTGKTSSQRNEENKKKSVQLAVRHYLLITGESDTGDKRSELLQTQ